MFLFGMIVGISATFALAKWLDNKKSRQAPKGPSIMEKLNVARKRLGQIANRDSIREARKIANTALKEIG